MRRSSFLAPVLLLMAAGCAPPAPKSSGGVATTSRSLLLIHDVEVEMLPAKSEAFVLSERCAQGPYELHYPVLEGQDGMYVGVTIEGGKELIGRWEAKYKGTSSVIGTFASTGADGKFVTKADNAACVVTAEEKGSGGSGGPPGSPPGGGGGGTPGGGAPSGGPGVVVKLVPVPIPNPRGRINANFFFWVDFQIEVGTEIVIKIWSVEPNDFLGATFVVETGTLHPRDAIKWKAAIEAKKSSDKADKDKQKRKDQCTQDFYAKKVWSEACRNEFGEDPSKRQERANACFAAWNKSHVWSEECRKEFGEIYDGKKKPSPAPWSPPPPAPADPKPPKPSTNAEWVPGSYQWDGFAWIWSAGVWRVPKKDIDDGNTAKAPTAPPAPKDEQKPPSPSPSSQWTPGYWFFSASAWIWIEGSWRTPPSPGATWKPFAWIKVGAVFVLDPGGWVVK